MTFIPAQGEIHVHSTPRLAILVLLASAMIPGLAAAPIVTAVANAASNIAFNAPIAQGAIFIIKGTGLGPANISIAPTPFQTTTLSGTSVTVTNGTTTVNALMYYTSATQVAALLPSNTPTGTGTFTVTFNGQNSNGANHGIAPSSLGIFTIDSSGQGPAIVTYADYSLVSASKSTPCGGPNTTCGAANPGDTLILWATGVGPVTGSDASGAGLGQNMPTVPLKVWLGGIQAPIIYQGRSGCCIGEDQIVFTVPDNVPTGCSVPLVVQIGDTTNTISNSTVIPIASGSRNCTPSNGALASTNVQQAVASGPVTISIIELGKFGTNTGFEDEAGSEFLKLLAYGPGSQPFFASWIDDQPPGTCIVYNHLNGESDPPILSIAPADPGATFTVKGPNGTATVKPNDQNAQGNLSPTGTFLVPGVFTVTGGGGADIGAFSASITIPPSPVLTSPANNSSVTRSNGMTITWTGGGAGNVLIRVFSALDNTFTTGNKAHCIAPASAGTFTIPPYVLLALPTGNFAGFTVAPGKGSVPFTAPGLNLGILQINYDGAGFGYGAGVGSFGLR